MTALQLFSYIIGALLLQLAIGVVIAMRRRADVGVPTKDQDPELRRPSGAWSGWREFRVARRQFEDRLGTQCSFYLEPLDGAALPPFSPGQYLTFQLQVPQSSADGRAPRILTRCYSLSDRPRPDCYRVTIKRVSAPAHPPGIPPGASSTHFHDRIHPGDVVRVQAPAGHFVLDPDPTVPIVLIAGGIGITPLYSMLRWCLAEQPARDIDLYYGVRNGDEHAFRQELEGLARSHARFRLHVIYSRPGVDDAAGRDYHHAGHADVDLVRRTLPHGRHQFYVCGPPPMMQNLIPSLVAWGVPQQDIHSEAFGPASARAAAPSEPPAVRERTTEPIEVRFQRSGRTLVWDGRDASLLEFAERHGVDIDSGCRSGACGTCETRLISGTVRYGRYPDHDVAAGHCLLCVGVPGTSVDLEA